MQNLYSLKVCPVAKHLQRRYLVNTSDGKLNTTPPPNPFPRNGSPAMAHTDSIIATFFQSNILDRQIGMSWYSNAHGVCVTFAAKYGFTIEEIAGAIAALSPNNKWERNIHDAEQLARAISVGIDPNEIKVCTFGKNKAKAIEILKGANYEEIKLILKGQKVTAFFENIACNGIIDAPVIDGHAFNIWNGTVSGLKEVPSISPKTFRKIQDAYRDAARIASDVTGERITATQIQAITWCCYRRIHKGLV